VLTRGPNGEVLPNPPGVEHIAEDPALRDTKLIAEAWDAAGLYQVGSFPNDRWSEWNGRFRDDIRTFWNGDPGQVRKLATRLSGSPDLYDRNNQTPLKSVNFVTCHDGFTLNDLVSYNEKHNLANEEDNRDGENHNHSRNYGHEGPTSDPAILAVRKRQMKNLLATVFLARGVPMLLAGDEMANTQDGNNNAYCQDNESSWLDWSLLKEHADLHAFVRDLIALRKQSPALRRPYFPAPENGGKAAPIQWFGADGNAPDWNKGVHLAARLEGEASTEGDTLLLIFNAGDKATSFALPPSPGGPWKVALSSEEKKPTLRKNATTLRVQAHSTNVLASP
jgi:glycogen operon protein